MLHPCNQYLPYSQWNRPFFEFLSITEGTSKGVAIFDATGTNLQQKLLFY
jgi:hypothetical protein